MDEVELSADNDDGFREKDDEFEYDEIRGAHGKKPKMAILNKKKINSYEMDELFLDF